MMLVFWLLLMALGVWWFEHLIEARQHPNANLATTGEANLPITLQRNAAGHFVAPGHINGKPVRFLLDTGASLVAVPGELAERLELEPGASADFFTANGRARGYLTRLDRVGLGGVNAHDVPGSINPGMQGDTVLLGMSFLHRFDIQIRGAEMTLSPAQPL
nr:TIGR02281 family clan AA aspartic protease [Halomonas lutea]